MEIRKVENEYEGWGTALKPAHEPVVMARKPVEGTVAENVLKHGTGGINIDGCRVSFTNDDDPRIGKGYFHHAKAGLEIGEHKDNASGEEMPLHNNKGRFPANVIHDGSEEVLDEFEKYGDTKSTGGGGDKTISKNKNVFKGGWGEVEYPKVIGYGDVGSPAKFFYSPKASKKEKGDTTHPTVKPIELMKYLVRLVTRKEGIVLDPFAGTGTTGEAALLQNRKYYMIEKNKKYFKDIEKRVGKFNELFV